MSIINFNSFSNSPINGGGSANRNESVRNRTDSAHVAGKQLVATGQAPEANVTALTEEFSSLGEIRHDVVENAKEKLANGYYDDRQTAIELAKTILDIT